MKVAKLIQLRVPAGLYAEIRTFAQAHGLGLSPAVRLLVGRAIRSGVAGDAQVLPADSPVALAALVAAEHAVLMVASVLPEGERRRRELGQRAAEAAEERLADFREVPA